MGPPPSTPIIAQVKTHRRHRSDLQLTRATFACTGEDVCIERLATCLFKGDTIARRT